MLAVFNHNQGWGIFVLFQILFASHLHFNLFCHTYVNRVSTHDTEENQNSIIIVGQGFLVALGSMQFITFAEGSCQSVAGTM